MSVQTNTPPLLRGLIAIVTIIIIFAAMRFSSPVLSPILIAAFIALLLGPVHKWLRGKMAGWLALILMIVTLIVSFCLLGYLFALSAQNLRTGLDTYATQLQAQIEQLASRMQSVGVNADAEALSPQALKFLLSLVVSALDLIVSYLFPVIILSIFLLIEGEVLFKRAQQSLPNNPVLLRLSTFGTSVARQFGIRAIVNAITGAGFALLLWLLGVDYAALWGVLTFFLSYIPYIGIVVAAIPAVILAFAEYGLERAILVIVALTVVNFSAENLLSPALMGRGLNLSTTVTFIGFMFWFWLLGAPGAFLAMPLTIVFILVFDSFPATKWLATVATRPNEAELAEAHPGKKTK